MNLLLAVALALIPATDSWNLGLTPWYLGSLQSAQEFNNSGFKKLEKGDLDGAIADYNLAIEIDPKYTRAYGNRGNAKEDKGVLDGAIADCTRAIEIDPSYAKAYITRGYLRYDRGTWTDAISDFRKHCELAPPHMDNSRLRIYLIRARLGERDAATKELAQFLSGRKTDQPNDWASMTLSFFTGDLSEADFLTGAESKAPKTDREQKYEACFSTARTASSRGTKMCFRSASPLASTTSASIRARRPLSAMTGEK